jgi:hypothetical protein
MTEVCRAFGISRKTGYKIFDRYKEHGLEALNDRSRRPVRYANQLPQQIESLILTLKHDKPHWGARKIRELLVSGGNNPGNHRDHYGQRHEGGAHNRNGNRRADDAGGGRGRHLGHRKGFHQAFCFGWNASRLQCTGLS